MAINSASLGMILRNLLLSLTFLFCFSCTASQPAETTQSKSELIQHTVMSEGHPMAVWEKRAKDAKGVILFVHGRTWSGVPDFDLQVEGENLSLMDGLVEKGYTTYAVDLRGYGATPRDETEWLSPTKAALDINYVMEWISEENGGQKVHLFGWSMGSTSSLLATTKDDSHIATLTIFGFWMDLDQTIPEDKPGMAPAKIINTAEAASSDFITPGSISQKAIDTYVEMALKADPVKVDWRRMNEFHQIDPSVISVPVLLLQGEFDPIAPPDVQAKLFTRLKTGNKSWIVVAGGDHAAFMETPRDYFIQSLANFLDQFPQ